MKQSKKAKALNKRYAERQRLLRAKRDALKQCRTCGAPAVVSQRTGRLTTGCVRHLACDANRKIPYVLAWEDSGELVFPLGAIP